MASQNTKKLSIIYILKILQEFSDENNLLTQKDIIDKMYNVYGIQCERKSVAFAIECLNDCGYEICTTKKGCYLSDRQFENSELRFLIDSVLYSKHVSTKHAKDLIAKLKSLGNHYFKKKLKDVYNINHIQHFQANSLFYTIDELGKAIEDEKQVKITIGKFESDKKLHPISENIIVNPYKLIYTEGKYFLVGNQDVFDNISNYQLDRIMNIDILSTSLKSYHQTSIGNDDLIKYLSKRSYVFNDKILDIRLKLDSQYIDEIVEKFGFNFKVLSQDEYDNDYIIEISASKEDFLAWLMKFSNHIEILSPQSLRDELRQAINNLFQKYNTTDDDLYNAEMERATLKFDEEDEMAKGDTLNLTNIDLRERESFKNLKNIIGAIFSDNKISDFSFLENYSKLRYLKIDCWNIEDLSVISKLKNLQKIDIRNTSLEDFSYLINCQNIRAICLCKNKQIKDYSFIYKMNNLEYFAITNYETNYIDIENLRKTFPKIKIYIGDETNFDQVTGISYEIDVNQKLNKDDYPVSLLKAIFGLLNMSEYELEDLNANLKGDNDFQTQMEQILSKLPTTEESFIRSYYKKGKSFQEICAILNISVEELVEYERTAYRALRHPSFAKPIAKLLKKFLAWNLKSNKMSGNKIYLYEIIFNFN